jgi:glucose/arabinose dehydrogenase
VGPPTIVINNINADGNGGAPQGHTTRTLEFDSLGRFYVSVGSNENVDPDAFRSRIRRFVIANVTFPIEFQTGEVFADGIRNGVAMAHDKHGVLWAADTGADNLQRQDLGGDITNDNPAEELLKLPEDLMGTHFGYPYCWTEYRLDEPYALGRGTAWAWPATFNITVTDEDCRTKYGQASVAMQAHSTPLGITFYKYKPPGEIPDNCPGGAFPESMDGYVCEYFVTGVQLPCFLHLSGGSLSRVRSLLIVSHSHFFFAVIAFHGSWNRDIPTGYKLVYVEMDADGNVASEPIDLLAHIPPSARWDDGFRPVDVDFDECGRLLLSSDGTGGRGSKIVRIESIVEQCDDSSGAPTNFPSMEDTSSSAPTSVPTSGGARRRMFVVVSVLLMLATTMFRNA